MQDKLMCMCISFPRAEKPWLLKELAKVGVGLSAGVPERIHTNHIERKVERRDATSCRGTGMKSM